MGSANQSVISLTWPKTHFTFAQFLFLLKAIESDTEPFGADMAEGRIVAEDVVDNEVWPHVYDVKAWLYVVHFGLNCVFNVGGAFHAGVEVYGTEWSFGSGGIDDDIPTQAEAHEFRCSLSLGRTPLTPREVMAVLEEFRLAWHGQDYHLISQNCCSFATAFCARLQWGE